MRDSKCYTEEEILAALTNAVDEVEVYTRKIGFEKFEQPLGFFFARVLDNKITRSEKRGKELKTAIIRGAAFIVVIQILIYTVLLKEDSKSSLINTIHDSKHLQSYFDEIENEKNFGAIFNARIVELLPKESAVTLNHVFQSFISFNKSQFTSDILGKIFHGLIPFELRKFLAAYYTSNVVGGFLSYLAIKNDQVKIMDPACGSGTLLVSAYKRIIEINRNLDHNQILRNIYGVDVSAFAAQLAAINLAIQKPTDSWNTCNIAILDFFRLEIGDKVVGFKVPKFDVFIGNPPFTRGDRLDSEYKDFLQNHLLHKGISFDYNKKYLGLYAYFLLDSLRFLKAEGILAFILPLSLINSFTMKPVLKFLMSKFLFIYIITSEAQITFSEQCSFKEILLIAQKGRKKSFGTKFVTLKKELTDTNYRKIAETIEKTTKNYEDTNIRIRTISTKTLKETLKMNWIVYFYNSKFITIFDQIRRSDTISLVNEIVENPRYDVDRGLRAGISDFFYLPNKFWKIVDTSNNGIKIKNIRDSSILNLSSKYLAPVLRKSSHCRCVIPESSDYIVVIPDKNEKEKDVDNYIKWAVQKFQKTGFESLTFRHISQKRKIARVAITHKLSLISSKIITYYSPKPIVLTDNFIFIRTFNKENDKILAAYLNSSIFLLTYLILRREKSGALGQIFGTDVRNFFCLDPRKVSYSDRLELIKLFDHFIKESSFFPSFREQINKAKEERDNIRFLLDEKICETLGIKDIPLFLKQLYETLIEELKKF
ncbi:MAG: class I SAM-dependent DNA methyltransferase [Promethearchaeota archaeon]